MNPTVMLSFLPFRVMYILMMFFSVYLFLFSIYNFGSIFPFNLIFVVIYSIIFVISLFGLAVSKDVYKLNYELGVDAK